MFWKVWATYDIFLEKFRSEMNIHHQIPTLHIHWGINLLININ